MEDMYQALRVRMCLDKLMEKSVINQVLASSTEESISLQTLSINLCSSKNIFNTARKHSILQHKLLEFRDKRIHTKRYAFSIVV